VLVKKKTLDKIYGAVKKKMLVKKYVTVTATTGKKEKIGCGSKENAGQKEDAGQNLTQKEDAGPLLVEIDGVVQKICRTTESLLLHQDLYPHLSSYPPFLFSLFLSLF
jgi:hypothetical protein